MKTIKLLSTLVFVVTLQACSSSTNKDNNNANAAHQDSVRLTNYLKKVDSTYATRAVDTNLYQLLEIDSTYNLQDAKMEILRRCGDLPLDEGKFNEDLGRDDPKLEAYWKEIDSTYHWLYATLKEDTLVWTIHRQARSNNPLKRECIGGKIIYKNNEVTYYEEGYYSDKFLPENLKKKGAFLFDAYLKGEINNYIGVEYVLLFPDKRTKWNKETLKWDVKY